MISEGGGQGLVTLACFQDLSQARHRWPTQADGFPSLFGTTVVLPGIGDVRTLEALSVLAGDTRAGDPIGHPRPVAVRPPVRRSPLGRASAGGRAGLDPVAATACPRRDHPRGARRGPRLRPSGTSPRGSRWPPPTWSEPWRALSSPARGRRARHGGRRRSPEGPGRPSGDGPTLSGAGTRGRSPGADGWHRSRGAVGPAESRGPTVPVRVLAGPIPAGPIDSPSGRPACVGAGLAGPRQCSSVGHRTVAVEGDRPTFAVLHRPSCHLSSSAAGTACPGHANSGRRSPRMSESTPFDLVGRQSGRAMRRRQRPRGPERRPVVRPGTGDPEPDAQLIPVEPPGRPEPTGPARRPDQIGRIEIVVGCPVAPPGPETLDGLTARPCPDVRRGMRPGGDRGDGGCRPSGTGTRRSRPTAGRTAAGGPGRCRPRPIRPAVPAPMPRRVRSGSWWRSDAS